MAQPRRRIPPGKCPCLGGLRMPPRRRAFAPGMAAGRREENYFSAPQGQNPPQNRQNPRNRNENPHRQSRPAASRIAGASNRSRQPTGDLRPPAGAGLSPAMPLSGEPDRWRFQQKQAADRGLSSLVPRGKVQEGEAPSWFPAPAPERIRIIFPATRAAGKILLTERRVGAALAGPAPKRSAIATGGTPGLARGNGGAISTKHYTERSVGAAWAGPAPKRSAIATGGTPGLARGNGGAISTKHYTERSVAARPPLGGLWAAPERSDWPSSQRPGGAETGPSRWRKSPRRF